MIAPSQAVEIAEHHHYSILVFFVIGWMIHAALQIDAVARAKNNPTNSRVGVVAQNWIRLLGRFFVALMIFSWFWHNPSAVPGLLQALGITLGTTAAAVLTLPISQPVAGMFGFFGDSALAYIPVLKNALPDPSLSTPDAPAAATAAPAAPAVSASSTKQEAASNV